jgi:hypothetical protein
MSKFEAGVDTDRCRKGFASAPSSAFVASPSFCVPCRRGGERGLARRPVGSRPFTPREAALDLGYDWHQLSDAVDDVMRAGRRQLLRRRGAASGEDLRC